MSEDNSLAFEPDRQQISITRAIGRVEAEMIRRIDIEYPPHRRIAIQAGMIASLQTFKELSSYARAMADNDARAFVGMMNAIALFRAAADLQITMLKCGRLDPNRHEFRSDQFWSACYDHQKRDPDLAESP